MIIEARMHDYEDALRDLLHFYDKVRGFAGHGEGWTAADVLRLEQIRNLAADGGFRRSQARSQAQMLRKQPNPKKRRKTRPGRS